MGIFSNFFKKKGGVMKRGFTLLELLIVVIIIGILAVIAVPQYFKAVANAKDSQAKAILRELRKAELAYNSIEGNWTGKDNLTDIDLDGDNVTDVSFSVPNVTDFNFTVDVSAGLANATKRTNAGKSIKNWTIHFANGTITSF